MYLERLVTDCLKSLAGSFPAVAVVGARQVGKSTLLEHVFGGMADFVVFDPAIDVENARQDPELFLDNHRTPLVLDEIQYAPELVAAIKRRIDRDRRPGCYIMSGSQQWGVLKSLSESLAGRVALLDLEGFCLAECAGRGRGRPWIEAWLDNPKGFVERRGERLPLERTLYETLWRGCLPEAQFLSDAVIGDFYSAYLRTYIERDVRLLAEVSDWQHFGRFVRLVSGLTSQEINHSQLGRELGLSPQTSRRWLDMLAATFQWFEVPAYSGNIVKRVSGKAKGYIADCGLVCNVQAISSPKAIAGHPLWGALFETAAVGEIRKQCSVLSPRPNVYHWRTYYGTEVDVLLERDGKFYPIEVKAKSNPSRSDTRGISAFRKAYPHLDIQPGLVLCPAAKVMKLSDLDYAMPWDIWVSS